MWTVIVLALLLFGLQRIDQSIRPLAGKVIEYQSKALAVQTIQQACNAVLKQNSDMYKNLYVIHRDSSGNVQSITADSARINSLEDTLVENVNQSLRNLQQFPLKIPFGTLTGVQVLSGRGPDVSIRVHPLSLASSQVRSEFSQAGVNQTNLEVHICFSVEVGALLAGEVVPVDAQADILAAQILIVGEVPQLYAQNSSDA